MRVSLKQAIRGGVSDPRNKNIFKMFSLIGIGERAGSGIENIYKVWDEQSWRKPEIIETFQPDRITMVLRTISLLPEKSLMFLKSIIGNQFNNLLKDEVVALVAAHQEKQITNARLQILINKNSIEANKTLSMLIDKKIFVPFIIFMAISIFSFIQFKSLYTLIIGLSLRIVVGILIGILQGMLAKLTFDSKEIFTEGTVIGMVFWLVFIPIRLFVLPWLEIIVPSKINLNSLDYIGIPALYIFTGFFLAKAVTLLFRKKQKIYQEGDK